MGMGYFEITRIKALVLRGLFSPPVGPKCLDLRTHFGNIIGIAVDNLNPADPSASLRTHSASTRLPPPSSSTPWRDSPLFLLWTERALSNYALVAYRCWLEAPIPATQEMALRRHLGNFIPSLPDFRSIEHL